MAQELFEDLENLNRKYFYLKDWLTVEFIENLFWVLGEMYLDQKRDFEKYEVSYLEAKAFLDLLDEISIDIVNQLSNGSSHEIVSLFR
jgi:hypothetical protein